MSKRSRPFPKNPESTNRKLYKEGGHGTYTKKDIQIQNGY